MSHIIVPISTNVDGRRNPTPPPPTPTPPEDLNIRWDLPEAEDLNIRWDFPEPEDLNIRWDFPEPTRARTVPPTAQEIELQERRQASGVAATPTFDPLPPLTPDLPSTEELWGGSGPFTQPRQSGLFEPGSPADTLRILSRLTPAGWAQQGISEGFERFVLLLRQLVLLW